MFGKSQSIRFQKASGIAGAGFLGIFGLPFLAAGLFISYIYFSGYANWWKARSWEEIPCTILSEDLKSGSGKNGSTSINATYRYRYNGRTYQGDRFTFEKGAKNLGSELKEKAHAQLSASLASGTPDSYRCFVDPSNPASSVLDRNLPWTMQGFLALFVLIFPAVGAGLVSGAILGVIATRKEWQQREAQPDKPWKWKPNWAGSTIPENGAGAGVFFYSYTLWFWLVIGPLAASAWIGRVYEYDDKVGIVLVPIAIGALMSWFAIRRFRSRKALGKCSFELKQWPASQGAMMSGDILLQRLPPASGDATVTLTCQQSTTRGSGKNSSTTVEKIWTHQEAIPLNRIYQSPLGQRLPVRFTLSADAPDSSIDTVDGMKINWQLDLRLPGSFPLISFDIPVFQQGEKAPARLSEKSAPTVTETSLQELPSRLTANRLIVDFAPSGFPRSIICPPARHRQLIVFLLLFNIVWTAFAVFLVRQHAPLIFRIVWPVSSALIWCSLIWTALHKRTATFDGNGLVITHQFVLLIWTRVFPKQDIQRFSHDSNMSSGNQSFHRVRLENVRGKKETVADAITETGTAAALVSLLEKWKSSSNPSPEIFDATH